MSDCSRRKEPKSIASATSDQTSRLLTQKLQRSQVYKDYERAFTEATGLPLALRPTGDLQRALAGAKNENPFCLLMGRSNQSCSACLQMQERLEREAGFQPKTLKCFAGLCDSAVPVRVGDNTIAFLQTGQILQSRPNRKQFSRVAKQLLDWGVEVDIRKAEEAYLNTRVLSPKQYESAVRLLSIFAQHLAALSNRILVQEQNAEAPAMAQARKFISENSDNDLSLNEVAKAVNMSAFHFCRMFKKSVGLSFTEYVARVRVEKAKNLLLNPHRRISEAAFESGFQSLSQFNRVFLKVVGCSPSRYRAGLKTG